MKRDCERTENAGTNDIMKSVQPGVSVSTNPQTQGRHSRKKGNIAHLLFRIALTPKVKRSIFAENKPDSY